MYACTLHARTFKDYLIDGFLCTHNSSDRRKLGGTLRAVKPNKFAT